MLGVLALLPEDILPPLDRSVPAALAASGSANAAAIATAMRDFGFSIVFPSFQMLMNVRGRSNDLPDEPGHWLFSNHRAKAENRVKTAITIRRPGMGVATWIRRSPPGGLSRGKRI
jgi:hypothetical protein